MALDVVVTAEINKNRKDVAEYAFEPTNDPVWIGAITQAKLLTDRPIEKGTQVQRLAKFMGKTIDYILEVHDFEPDYLMVMESVKSPFPMKVTYKFDALENNITLAQIRVQGSAGGYYGFADFLMAPIVKRNLKGDLRRLKTIMEK